MSRQAISIGLIIVAALMAVGAQAQDKLVLKSVNVDLPFGERMFQGPGSEALNNNCLACHSAGMVLTQPALSREQWHAEVEKMLTAYKAPTDPKDIDAIVNSLMGVQQAK
jgi:cytochrome c553